MAGAFGVHTINDKITELLRNSKTIAVVGLSDSPFRASHGVSAYMQAQGYKIIPVNPTIESALGESSVPSLLDIKEKIDIVDVFRRSEFVPELVDQAIQLKVPVLWLQEGVVHEAIQLKVPVLWLQEGVVHEAAAEKARKAGITVIMDKCILKEHRARFR